jgi:hypothetical protein
MSECPECHNQFVQPFVCTTCGAAKLYDATVTSLQARNEALRAGNERLRKMRQDELWYVADTIKLTRTMLLGNAREQLEDLMAWAKNRATQEPSESAGAVPFRKCDDCPSHMAAACVEFSRCGLGAFQRQEEGR